MDGAFNNPGISQGAGLLAAGRPGAIVNTSSVGGVKADRNLSVYLATKHGVIGLSDRASYINGAVLPIDGGMTS